MAAPSRCRRTLAPLARRGVCFGMTPTPLLSSSAKARSPWSALLETPALLVRNCPVNPPDRFDTRATGNGALAEKTMTTQPSARRREPSYGSLPAAQLLGALKALKRGDFAVRLPLAQSGIAGQIAEAFNDVAEVIKESTDNFYRISTAVGKEGKIHERMPLGNTAGSWAR